MSARRTWRSDTSFARRFVAEEPAGPVGYPASAIEMADAVGFGTWSAGWLLNELVSPGVPAFGGANLVEGNAPTWGVDGALAGSKALRLPTDGGTEYAAVASSAVLDAGAADDIIMAWVARFYGAPGGTRIWLGKRGATAINWSMLQGPGAGGQLIWQLTDGTNTVSADVSDVEHIDGVSWHVGIAAWERGSVNQARVATSKAVGAAASPAPGALGSLSNASVVGVGRGGFVTARVDVDAFWVGVGPGAATGLVANIAEAVENLRAYIGVPA